MLRLMLHQPKAWSLMYLPISITLQCDSAWVSMITQTAPWGVGWRGGSLSWGCALTRQWPGEFLDFDGAQFSAPQVDVFIGVELQKEDGVEAESRRTPHWKKEQSGRSSFHLELQARVKTETEQGRVVCVNVPISITSASLLFTGNPRCVCVIMLAPTALSYLLIAISQQRIVRLARANLWARSSCCAGPGWTVLAWVRASFTPVMFCMESCMDRRTH